MTDGSYDPERYQISDWALETMELNWQATMRAEFDIHSYEELEELLTHPRT